MTDRTKQLFAEKLQELARTRPIKSIQVKDLCALCGMDRTSFYYHFKDKYDLVSWIFKQNYIEEAKRAEVINDEQMICRMTRRLYAQRDFFLNALQDDSQNNLRQYMLDFYIETEKRAVCAYLGTDEPDEETWYEICNYSYGCMGHTIDWLMKRNTLTPEKMAHYQYEFMPKILKEAFREAGRPD
jgi:AcrR family transcriptional regulator